MKYLVLIVSFFILFASCNKKNEIKIKSIELPSESKPIVEANNIFGLNTFSQIINTSEIDQNIIFSPLSLNIALLMTLNGADGNTANEIKNTLQVSGLSIEQINDCYKILIDELITTDRNVLLSIANSMWFDNSFFVFPEFISSLSDNYNAKIDAIDFTNPNSVNDINSWVKKNTNKKIDKIIDNFEPDEKMALLNAIYFEGQWHFDFDQSETSLQDFFLDDGTTIQVQTMTQNKTLKIASSQFYTAVELPYGQGNFVMDIFMPNEGFSIDTVIDSLLNFKNIINDFYSADVELFLPQFQYEYNIKLNDILIDIGMPTAFTDLADFSKISDKSLAISRVLQKSYINVNEKGTEAASVTFVGFNDLASLPPAQIKLNKPFVYLIREVSTNTIIFIGRVSNPSKN
ncbi:MAG: serpin family protein [Bacteroidales bacterium]|nr:serpin family protein [Bacteroidales bacterium]